MAALSLLGQAGPRAAAGPLAAGRRRAALPSPGLRCPALARPCLPLQRRATRLRLRSAAGDGGSGQQERDAQPAAAAGSEGGSPGQAAGPATSKRQPGGLLDRLLGMAEPEGLFSLAAEAEQAEGKQAAQQAAADAGGEPSMRDKLKAASPQWQQKVAADAEAAILFAQAAQASQAGAAPVAAAAAGGGAAASAATATAAAAAAGGPEGAGPGAAAALATFFRVLFDTLRVLLRLLLLEPLTWVLNRCGLLAIQAQEVVSHLEQANKVAPLEPERLAAALRVLNKQHPKAVVDFVEKNCLGGGPAEQAAAGGAPASKFAMNSSVVREYLSALVATGKLSQYGDPLEAAPGEGQSHRSMPQLLGELQAAAAGAAPAQAPGATVARPLHVIVQAQDKGGGFFGAISSFFWTCVGMFTFFYVMAAGQASFRRFQGGGLGQTTLPGGAAGVAATASGREAAAFAAKEYSKENLPESSVKKFGDVKGCDEAIAELQEIVEYLKKPEKFTRLGGKLPKGVLLTGPPGTGKTLLARAVAGEAGVPFFYKAGSEFDEMFVGVGSRRVRSLFAAAKKKAPCIIFIDEIDAMGGKRTNWESSGGSRKTLNQLLTDMDGFEENSGVVVMAATNLPELLDTALTRPGRFDRQVAVTLPDVRGRQQILDLYLTGKPLSPDVDTEILARRTPGFSGAELANLVNEAALLAARHDSEFVTEELLDEARDKILMGTPRVLTQSDEARRLTAYHEGGHALVALHTRGAKPIHKATIVPRGHALGMVSQVPEKDEYSITRQQLLASIDVCMGGRAAEELIFGEDHITTGATSDLQQATRMARHMVVDCGMSDRIGPVAVGQEQSPATRQLVDGEIQQILKSSYTRVINLLRAKEGELHKLAQALLREETLTEADIKSLLVGASSAEQPGGGPGSGSHTQPEPVGARTAPAGDAAVPAAASAAAAAAAAGSLGGQAAAGQPAAAAAAPPAAA